MRISRIKFGFHELLLVIILLASSFVAIPVSAEDEIATTTPEIITPVETPTTTPTPEPETPAPTSTPPTETPTTTEDITQNPDNITQTSTTTPITNDLISNDLITDTVNRILNYFKTQQSADGKIMDGTITDWVIMSFGANGQYADDVKVTTSSLLDYEKKYNLDDPSDLNACATYPRHILALLAAGVEQTDPAITGLKDKISSICYKDGMYGLNGINDDVFALLALSALNVNQAEPIMRDVVSTTLAWQIDNGAFTWPDWFNPSSKVAGDDITGATINALKYAQTKGATISDEILTKAKNYLKSTQQTDGGWGYGSSDVMTTSWVLMGINAIGDTQNDWFVTSTGKNPWYPLVNNLKPDGFYESVWVPGTVDWFAMKHAVPALLGKYWPIVMAPKVTNFSEGATFTYNSNCCSSYTPPTPPPTPTPDTQNLTPTTTPTTTIDMTQDSNSMTQTPTSTAVTITIEQLDPAKSADADSGASNETIATSTQTVTTTQNTNNKIQEKNINFKIQNAKYDNHNSEIDNLQSAIISPAPPETPPEPANPVSSTAKKLFAGSSIAAGGLGLYLAWRLLQTLV